MSRMLETLDGFEVEVPDEVFVRVKLKTASMLIELAQSLSGTDRMVAAAEAAEIALKSAIQVLHDS